MKLVSLNTCGVQGRRKNSSPLRAWLLNASLFKSVDASSWAKGVQEELYIACILPDFIFYNQNSQHKSFEVLNCSSGLASKAGAVSNFRDCRTSGNLFSILGILFKTVSEPSGSMLFRVCSGWNFKINLGNVANVDNNVSNLRQQIITTLQIQEWNAMLQLLASLSASVRVHFPSTTRLYYKAWCSRN